MCYTLSCLNWEMGRGVQRGLLISSTLKFHLPSLKKAAVGRREITYLNLKCFTRLIYCSIAVCPASRSIHLLPWQPATGNLLSFPVGLIWTAWKLVGIIWTKWVRSSRKNCLMQCFLVEGRGLQASSFLIRAGAYRNLSPFQSLALIAKCSSSLLVSS